MTTPHASAPAGDGSQQERIELPGGWYFGAFERTRQFRPLYTAEDHYRGWWLDEHARAFAAALASSDHAPATGVAEPRAGVDREALVRAIESTSIHAGSKEIADAVLALLAVPQRQPAVSAELRALLQHLPAGPLKLDISEIGEGPDRRPIAFVMSDDEQYLLVDEDPPCVDDPPAPYAQAAVECINFVRNLIATEAPARLAAPPADADAQAAERVKRTLQAILREAKAANDVIKLKRDGSGQGRIRVATAMHRIAQQAEKALHTTNQPAADVPAEATARPVADWPAPDGWKLVPVEPTEEMLAKALGQAMFDTTEDRHWLTHAANVYDVMLSAAPTPPARQDQGGGSDE